MSAELEQPIDNAFSYDEVPYESYSYPHTHPASLHAVGTLFKTNPPALETARVLELGCAGGGNIIPLAIQFPKAEFYGIDLGQVQIDDANKQVADLGLKNIKFDQMDIMDFPQDAGKFDYIICHGILSWVPKEVAEGIMKLSGKHLSDNGLAIISYNCLPGWNFVKSIREMMLFHASRFESPQDRLKQSKALLAFLDENVGTSLEAYKKVIETERNTLQKTNDSYLFHDHLEIENNPYYLHEVNAMAVQNDLSYVGDTSVSTMFLGNLKKEAAEKLGGLNNVILQEQYMDFLSNRRFRNSIFTKKTTIANRNIDNQEYAQFYITPLFKKSDEGQEHDIKKPNTYVSTLNKNVTFTSKSPEFNAFLITCLENTKKPKTGEELLKEAIKTFDLQEEKVRSEVAANFFKLYFLNLFILATHRYEPATEVSEKPVAYKLARYQVEKLQRSKITSIAGNDVTVDKISGVILGLLDGTKTVNEIADALVTFIEETGEKIQKDGETVTDKEEQKLLMQTFVKESLIKFANVDLLEA